MWYQLKNLKRIEPDTVSADIKIPRNSPWFSGHFPGDPILPGISQLGMVFDIINQSTQEEIKISSIRRVRFKQIIRPNDLLTITATSTKKEADAYSFRVTVDKQLVCSGIMVVTN